MRAFFDSGVGGVLRWAAFLPASIIAYILCTLVVALILYIFWMPMYYEETVFTFTLRYLLANGVGGFSFVFVGCYIAPKYKKSISVILAGIFIFFSIMIIALGLNLGIVFEEGSFEGWKDILGALASITGASYACWGHLYDNLNEC